MNPDAIRALLVAAFPDAQEIQVTGDSGKFQVIVVSEMFVGMRPVAKQQKIYAPLNEHIASGAIHAVSMQTLTPEEWRKMRLFG
ncbi:acid stress-induced BolA-like protein IbaG/YrbA [Fluviicoccus keumensis]|uniref:Acid stress-induced BolA-like protein IbaG/YrbA n=1 Tax=Fluviicoccus keumensis TaxID=1435465 RepID=A0A4Q7YDZ6_9GAMM|nr:BolA family protein [Fluviicoccus keumensis]RZU35340.1 acid stress-induced BolA-like protein IbaG/YrbA [Fluviicoccus keumensis]